MSNKKKEGGFYASKARLFLNEYDGKRSIFRVEKPI